MKIKFEVLALLLGANCKDLALNTGFLDDAKLGMECNICKAGSFMTRHTFGSEFGRQVIADSLIFTCENILPLVGYECSLTNLLKLRTPVMMSLLFDQMLSTRVLCTY